MRPTFCRAFFLRPLQFFEPAVCLKGQTILKIIQKIYINTRARIIITLPRRTERTRKRRRRRIVCIRRSSANSTANAGALLQARTLVRSCSNVLASPAGALFKLRNAVGAKGAQTFAVMAKSVHSKQRPRKNRAASVVAILPRQAGAGHTVAPPNVPLFSLRGRTVAGQSTNGALFCGASLRTALPQAFVFFLLRAAPPDKAYRERHCPLPAAEKA